VRLGQRIATDVLAVLAEHGALTGDDLRQLVRGQGRRVDGVVRMLVAGGRVSRTRAGFVLASRGGE
jgi:hypothetical protein